MDKKTWLAALAAAAALTAGIARAQNNATPSGSSPDGAPGYDQSAPARDQAVPSNDADKTQTEQQRRNRRARRQREEQTETPNRMEPSRAFPGDLPEKTTTPGSLDREGRVIQQNRVAPLPKLNSPSDDQSGEYK